MPTGRAFDRRVGKKEKARHNIITAGSRSQAPCRNDVAAMSCRHVACSGNPPTPQASSVSEQY
eukprot:8154666-Heterocapsa_arctica.AAC.1